MTDTLHSLLSGTEVHARGLRWEIVGMLQQGEQTLVRLRGIEGAMLGRELDLLYPLEHIEPIQHELSPDRAAPLQNWLVYHQAFLLEQALGSNAMLSVQAGRLRVEPYQLVPVLRAIRMSRPRLMLADGVGLGKTIQAGLILTELIARRLAHRILVISPAGPLMEQWRMEMRERFGLRLHVIDRASLEEIRRSTELGSNPFDHVPVGIVSIDFLKQDRILDLLDRATYDVVIIDEAHHCSETGSVLEREYSQRRKLAVITARNCDSLLLLTATPHDGNDRSFASLCELLDPSLVDGKGMLRGERYRRNVVRRLKRHILVTDPKTGETKSLFPDRIVTPMPVVADPEKHTSFVEMQRKLLDLIAPELRRAFRSRKYSDVLGWIALLKRSVSSAHACGQTLDVVATRYQALLNVTAERQEERRQRITALKEYEKRLRRFGTVTADEESERTVLEAEEIAQQLASLHREKRSDSSAQSKVAHVVDHLDELVELAMQAKLGDPKIDALVETIGSIREKEPQANVLVYTEYVDSQTAIVDGLKFHGLTGIITMNGDDDEKTRSLVTDRFRSNDGLILVSTDSASEGLNMHHRCHHLVHFELPFNPNRLEQRNGRIDRYGQTKEPHVRYLYLRGTFEERILLRLIAKYEKQRARLTFVPNTLGIETDVDVSTEKLLKGLLNEDAKLFEDQVPLFDLVQGNEDEGADEATMELLQEIDRSLSGFNQVAKTLSWLGEAGLNAESSLMDEADQARQTGDNSVEVSLADFVCDAVRLDGGRVTGKTDDDVFLLHLPPQWLYGLDDIAGYESSEKIVRLTNRIDITTDDKGRSVGFIGRAHPLVRRALDRVRNLSFGGDAVRGQDQRVSVVKADVPESQILFTFLGRVSSKIGREYERVLGVRISQSGASEFLRTPDRWMNLTDISKAIRTTSIWEKQFKSWANGLEGKAREDAIAGFESIATEFMEDRKKELVQDRENLGSWIKNRADEITGSVINQIEQTDIFKSVPENGGTKNVSPSWRSLEDPVERLAAFHADRSKSPAVRSEADGVVRLYKQRMKDLTDRSKFSDPEIIPLGMLMIVPEDSHGS